MLPDEEFMQLSNANSLRRFAENRGRDVNLGRVAEDGEAGGESVCFSDLNLGLASITND